MALAFAVTAGSLTSPGTAYAKHGDGAAIALGIIGGALAGAAIASSTGWLWTLGRVAVILGPGDAQRTDTVGFDRLLPSLELFG
jgi:hypothetical protein